MSEEEKVYEPDCKGFEATYPEEPTTKYVELHLAYFKQGDDLAHCLKHSDNNTYQGLKHHAELMRHVANHLDEVAAHIEGRESEVDIDAGTHHIGVTMPVDLANLLLEKELVAEDPFEDEREDNCEECKYFSECWSEVLEKENEED